MYTKTCIKCKCNYIYHWSMVLKSKRSKVCAFCRQYINLDLRCLRTEYCACILQPAKAGHTILLKHLVLRSMFILLHFYQPYSPNNGEHVCTYERNQDVAQQPKLVLTMGSARADHNSWLTCYLTQHINHANKTTRI